MEIISLQHRSQAVACVFNLFTHIHNSPSNPYVSRNPRICANTHPALSIIDSDRAADKSVRVSGGPLRD